MLTSFSTVYTVSCYYKVIILLYILLLVIVVCVVVFLCVCMNLLIISCYSSFLVCYSLSLFTASFVCPHENNVFMQALRLGGAASPGMPFMICAHTIIFSPLVIILFSLIKILILIRLSNLASIILLQ